MDRRSRRHNLSTATIRPVKNDLAGDHNYWLLDLIAYQVDLITTLLLSLISPFFTSPSDPHSAVSRARSLLRRLVFGFIGALYAGAALLAVAAVAVMLGLLLVELWADEPVIVREPLYFDYTEPFPSARVSLSDGKGRPVPAGHAVRASLQLVMPESDYNMHVGIFQVNAEALSSKGNIIATSSQPCMMKFRSLPVRLTHTFLMGVPLLLGMSTESQEMMVEILRYKESNQKTEMIRIKLMPRAGTSDLPQIYSAVIHITSQLPWTKELVYNWKWTVYVWSSLFVYVFLLTILVCYYKSFFQPGRSPLTDQPPEVATDESYTLRDGEQSDALYDKLRKWQLRHRIKRKAPALGESPPELAEGYSSSTSEAMNDSSEFAASESSVCTGG
ncbi:Seipin family protein [Dioscorea alata]|uniref:Seipin family protein n=1 Tax=Dioscorea alata TaxID=55571 RepID=A0ACB7VA73_DIOAL|nr:Seipin family protein [Dioscorea alata]